MAAAFALFTCSSSSDAYGSSAAELAAILSPFSLLSALSCSSATRSSQLNW